MRELRRLAKTSQEQKNQRSSNKFTSNTGSLGVMCVLAIQKWKTHELWKRTESPERDWKETLIKEVLLVYGDDPAIRSHSKQGCFAQLTSLLVSILLEFPPSDFVDSKDYYDYLKNKSIAISSNPAWLKDFMSQTKEEVDLIESGIEFLFAPLS
jgi:hypothetical protein